MELILGGNFVLAGTSMEVVLGMLFFLFSDADIDLAEARTISRISAALRSPIRSIKRI